METLLIFGAINIGAMLFGGAINAGLLKWHQKKTKKSFDELINQLDQRQIQRDNTRVPSCFVKPTHRESRTASLELHTIRFHLDQLNVTRSTCITGER